MFIILNFGWNKFKYMLRSENLYRSCARRKLQKQNRKTSALLAHLAKGNVSVWFRFIWPSSFRGEDLKKSANQKQELPVAAEGFQRRRLKCEKLTDDRQRTTSDGKNSHCLWQGELTMLKFFGFVAK
jgi:hypothetical protein